MKLRHYFYLLLLFVLFVPASHTNGQEKDKDKNKDKDGKWEFCQNNSNWGGRPSFNEVREMTIAKPGLLTVDGKKNGGISVRGENRSDVQIRACVQTWGDSESSISFHQTTTAERSGHDCDL